MGESLRKGSRPPRDEKSNLDFMAYSTIWVIEEGEYEQRSVCGVGASPEKCVELLKEQHIKFQKEHPEARDHNGWEVKWGDLTHEVCTRSDIVGWDYWQIESKSNGSTRVYEIRQYNFMP